MTLAASHGAAPLLGWVVDVQRDFMDPDGRLYVHDLFNDGDPGAQEARAAIVQTVAWMRMHCRTLIYTGDWHAYGDREIDTEHPDASKGTYPPHCMGMSPNDAERSGADLIPEIDPGERLLVLRRDATAPMAVEIARTAVQSGRPIFIQKKEFSCFEGNPATDALLEALTVEMSVRPQLVVCGVATDVCVRYAVEGLLDRGLVVSVVRDATWGLGLLHASETYERWALRGARIVMVDELQRQLA